MAQALQCPTCGSTTRLDGVDAGATLRCDSCGQVMKVPPGVGRRPSPAASSVPSGAGSGAASGAASGVAAGAGTAAGAVSTGAVAPPAPRRRSRPTSTAGGTAAGGTAEVAASAGAVAGGTAVMTGGERPVAAPKPEARRGARGRASVGGGTATARDALPLWLRIGAWLIALPLGLAIVGIPARRAGYLSSQKLLDVIVKHDLSRFVPIVVIVALWALVTALLVTAFVEGGRRLMLRRRETKDQRATNVRS